MAITPGKACVNRAAGKPSYISLESDTDVFSKDSGVSVVDEDGNIWNASPVFKGNKKILQIRLKGKRPKDLKEDSAPDTGQLTVTVSSPATTVPVPVIYVEDPNP
jgi:hypothetical protein